MTDSNAIIITSIIETTELPLYYSKIRSVYSHQERFEQTLETIESIRKYMPSTDIILVECSRPSIYMDTLAEKVDQFINLEFSDAIKNGTHKGIGEAILLLHAISNLQKSYTAIYKITGRYVLLPLFTKSIWDTTSTITVCETDRYGMKNSLHTFFYKIPSTYIDEFKDILISYLHINSNIAVDIAIENFLALHLKNITRVKTIGILARWSCNKKVEIY